MGDPRGNEVRARRERKHPLDIAMFFLLLGTLGATGFAAYYTGQQWRTAHETLVISERAFIYLGGVNTVSAKDPDPKKGEFLAMVTSITNSGNTRTAGLEFLVRCVTSPTRLVEPWGLLHQEAEEHLPQVIAPKSSVPVICSFKKSDVADMFDGKLFGYLMGDIRYQDIFQPTIRHLTQFSALVTVNKYTETPFATETQLGPVGKHNCADEDCPP
jgi:hypothetical protein